MGLGQKKSGKSKMFRDGRIVLSDHHWDALRLWVFATFPKIFGELMCHICGHKIIYFWALQLDHPTGRGLGGGSRDDRTVKPSHAWCNLDKGSRRTTEAYKPCPKKYTQGTQNEGAVNPGST